MPLPATFTMNNGLTIPTVGLGTWQSKPSEVKKAVEAALGVGYRHIDAAACYDNEKEVGDGIKASGVNRKDIFLTSKLWNTHHRAEDVERQLDASLVDLQTGYVDLYLIHWPVAFRRVDETERFPINKETFLLDIIDVPLTATWTAMEALVKKGKAKSIGVSNFSIQNLERVWDADEIKPVVNQVELHPYFQQQELQDWCKQKNILLEAYSPLGNNIYSLPKGVDDPEVASLALKLGKTPAQVILSWVLQRGIVFLTKSVTPSRIEQNLQVSELPTLEFERMGSLDRKIRYNFPVRYGVDIFGDATSGVMEKAVEEFRTKQKQLRGVA